MANMFTVTLVLTLCVSGSAILLPSPRPKKILSTEELRRTDSEVNNKLSQLHNTIEALQKTMQHRNDGYDFHTRQNADQMKIRFEKLSAVISRLTQHNSKLFMENRALRQEKTVLVNKIAKLESELHRIATEAKNAGVQAWMRKTATDLRSFLEESGLEHFGSPRFSPIIAGLVSNGVVMIPLTMATFFLLHFSKQLSVLRIVMALNLFDLGFAATIIASSALLLGDPFEGMRHISEVNFVFIQMVLSGVFWLTFAFLVAAIVQNRSNRAWKYSTAELLLRSALALDYGRRVWSPVMERDDIPIALPVLSYILYLCAAVANVYLTSQAAWYSVHVEMSTVRSALEEQAIVPLATHHQY